MTGVAGGKESDARVALAAINLEAAMERLEELIGRFENDADFRNRLLGILGGLHLDRSIRLTLICALASRCITPANVVDIVFGALSSTPSYESPFVLNLLAEFPDFDANSLERVLKNIRITSRGCSAEEEVLVRSDWSVSGSSLGLLLLGSVGTAASYALTLGVALKTARLLDTDAVAICCYAQEADFVSSPFVRHHGMNGGISDISLSARALGRDFQVPQGAQVTEVWL